MFGTQLRNRWKHPRTNIAWLWIRITRKLSNYKWVLFSDSLNLLYSCIAFAFLPSIWMIMGNIYNSKNLIWWRSFCTSLINLKGHQVSEFLWKKLAELIHKFARSYLRKRFLCKLQSVKVWINTLLIDRSKKLTKMSW